MSNQRRQALWYDRTRDNSVTCRLCARYCSIKAGTKGFCSIRRNENGTLVTDAWGLTLGLSTDPVEKKPLYHFLPGSKVLSFGTYGCNMACSYCQNWELAREIDVSLATRRWTATELIDMALHQECLSMAYTYNEPVIFAEWLTEVAAEARTAGLKNIIVTNGYVSPEARSEVFQHIDAANVDLKSFSDDFYRRMAKARLKPVLDTLRWLVYETSVWTEITTLLIPSYNDSRDEISRLSRFIARELGSSIPLHFTAFHGSYRMQHHPSTPLSTLLMARNIALESGLHHVYLGNIMSEEGSSTNCPECGATLIIRPPAGGAASFLVQGACPECQRPLEGVFA